MIPLSIVMPVFNEAAQLPQTIEALLASVDGSGFDVELLLVDDGSTDDSAAVSMGAVAGRLPLRILRQPNRGRFEARRAGLNAATCDSVLLLDGRVQLDPGALAFVRERLEAGADVWTGHVDIEADGNVYATFWKLIADLAWRDYFDAPRETSFGAEEFDRFPKGTGCFVAPRQLLVDALASFRSRYADLRHANDDTPLLRWIAEKRPINISPRFRATYRPRMTMQAFVRHSAHRGLVFVDGHGRRESRFFPAFVAFYPASLLLAVATVRRPIVLPLSLLAASGTAAGFGVLRQRGRTEVASLALLAPVYAVAHGFGMWRGLVDFVRARVQR
jgi:glycosyltransferase involved in cell wall biosynthesis